MKAKHSGKNGNMFENIYYRKKVFISGHTGFKGSWLAYWLNSMGAIVKGYALPPDTSPSHWELLKPDMESVYADIRDVSRLQAELQNFKPEIVFHLAAQPIVRISYELPLETYDTNVMGTLKLFEACRKVGSVKAIVNVTTDKCYENREWEWGYRENDILGGYDPYSSSKACSEIMTASYRNSYLNLKDYGKTHNILIATARAGNVVGGGDWATDRLIPDIMRATANKNPTIIRSPSATRPWQHVLEPLSGYLLLGAELLKGNTVAAESWNFGPYDSADLSVRKVGEFINKYWPKAVFDFNDQQQGPHEATLLKLDCSKAISRLKWKPVWDNDDCFMHTTNWYKAYYESQKTNTATDLESYILEAKKKNIAWSI
jgi:CDP-glucose 4,6-dehydratase